MFEAATFRTLCQLMSIDKYHTCINVPCTVIMDGVDQLPRCRGLKVLKLLRTIAPCHPAPALTSALDSLLTRIQLLAVRTHHNAKHLFGSPFLHRRNK